MMGHRHVFIVIGGHVSILIDLLEGDGEAISPVVVPEPASVPRAWNGTPASI